VEANVSGSICVRGNIQVDYIVEKTPGHGVLIDEVLILDSSVCTEDLFVSNIIAKNGGDIFFTGNLYPSIPDTFNIGSEEHKWKTITSGNLAICHDANIQGTLTVGILIQANNIQISDMLETVDLCVTGNLYTDRITSKTTGNVVIKGNLIPDTSNIYNLGAPNKRFCEIYAKRLFVSGVPGEPIIIGCLISISDTKLVGGSVANNDQYFTISTINTTWEEALYLEARMSGISVTGDQGLAGIIRGGVLNNGNPPGNLIRMNGTDETVYQTNASNWNIRLIPNSSGGAVTGNVISFQAKYKYTPAASAIDVTWKSCIMYYTVTPLN
jgi:hypothetical protein